MNIMDKRYMPFTNTENDFKKIYSFYIMENLLN